MLLVEYLTKLNTESIYYNVLTHHVLTKEIKNINNNNNDDNNKCLIDEIFKIKNTNISLKFN